ncbi:MAG: hypothetical protein ACI9CD_001070 [Candidatus Deianiraeaceae bacterium]|jgi:hypothetical protein
MNNYKELILQNMNANVSPHKIIDKLYQEEFIKYLRYGNKPNHANITQAIEETLYTRTSLHNKRWFNFVNAVQNGQNLFIGEGNFICTINCK